MLFIKKKKLSYKWNEFHAAGEFYVMVRLENVYRMFQSLKPNVWKENTSKLRRSNRMCNKNLCIKRWKRYYMEIILWCSLFCLHGLYFVEIISPIMGNQFLLNFIHNINASWFNHTSRSDENDQILVVSVFCLSLTVLFCV